MTITTSAEPKEYTGSIDVEPVRDGILIDGQWERGAGAAYEVNNPATGDLVQAIHQASEAQAKRAIEAADKAWKEPRWRAAYPHERARYLYAIAEGIDTNAEWLAALQTANTGKSINETLKLVGSAAGTFRYFAGLIETADYSSTAQRGPWRTTAQLEPLGVVLAITPWNSPIASDAQKIAPALAAGNAVVLKPATWTPLVSMALMEIIRDAGLPDGLCTVLPGTSSEIGDVIINHRKVGKIAFTGGTKTGARISAAAAQRFIPCTLELGGKSPNIVLRDAELDETVAGILYGIFSSSGQSCIAGSRLLIPREMYREVVDRVVAGAQALKLGPGIDPSTQVAPLVHPRHRDDVASRVELARQEGGNVLCGGHAPEGTEFEAGNYYLPTVIDGLPNSARTCQEEIFGPVLVCIPYDTEDELIEIANDSEFGLAAGLWTRDYRAAQRIADRLDAGTVWINTYKQFSISTPFSGFKNSGLGVDKGRTALAEYSRTKSLYWGQSEHAIPWSKPQGSASEKR